MSYKCVLRAADIQIFRRTDCEHSGQERKVSGYTSQQWGVLANSEAESVDKLALEFSRANVSCPESRSLRRWLSGGEGSGTQLRA
jgi:hypothetical protein